MYVTITTHFYISTLLLLSTKKSVSYLKPREFDAEISAALVKRLKLNIDLTREHPKSSRDTA